AAFDAGQAVIVQDSTGTIYYDPVGHNGRIFYSPGFSTANYATVAQLDHSITASDITLRAGSLAPSPNAVVTFGTANIDDFSGYQWGPSYFDFVTLGTLQTGDTIEGGGSGHDLLRAVLLGGSCANPLVVAPSIRGVGDIVLDLVSSPGASIDLDASAITQAA